MNIPVQELPFRVLTILLERPGAVVTREELREKLWPANTFVEFEHSLNTAVNKLRAALGDSVESPHYIETIPRRGYRFVATLEDGPMPLPVSRRPGRRKWLYVVAALVVLLAVVAWLGLSRRAGAPAITFDAVHQRTGP